jgi:acyl-CoA reductase-like NAD-dependent aldehyde dehydrogenase
MLLRSGFFLALLRVDDSRPRQTDKTMMRLSLPISTGKCVLLFTGLLAAYVYAQECPLDTKSPPFIRPMIMQNGKVLEPFEDMAMEEVMGCCASDRERLLPQVIGKMPQMTTEQTLQVLYAAKQAWNGGSGTWPQMPLSERVAAVDKFLVELKKQREHIVTVLMWEIGKNYKDAASEFDRTVQFAEEVMDIVKTDQEFLSASWQSIGSTRAFVRRAAIGILLCLGPYNYPLNETYATLIPALLMGNIVLLKIPTIGGLSHLLTSKCTFELCLLSLTIISIL